MREALEPRELNVSALEQPGLVEGDGLRRLPESRRELQIVAKPLLARSTDKRISVVFHLNSSAAEINGP